MHIGPLADAPRVICGTASDAASCRRRGLLETSSLSSLILALAYPSRSDTFGSLSTWFQENCFGA